MKTELLSNLGISTSSPEKTVTDFISVLKDKAKKGTAAFTALKDDKLHYFTLLLMVVREQHSLEQHSFESTLSQKITDLQGIKNAIGVDYSVFGVDGDQANKAFNDFLMDYQPNKEVTLQKMVNGNSAADAVRVLEKIFDYPYTGNVCKFAEHCLNGLHASMSAEAPNQMALYRKVDDETRTMNILYILNDLAATYNIKQASLDQLANISAYSDIKTIDTVSLNKAAKDVAAKLKDGQPKEDEVPPVTEFVPVVNKPLDVNEDIDDDVMNKIEVEEPEFAPVSSVKITETPVEVDADTADEDTGLGEEVLGVIDPSDEDLESAEIVPNIESALSWMLSTGNYPTDKVAKARLIGLMTVLLKELDK